MAAASSAATPPFTFSQPAPLGWHFAVDSRENQANALIARLQKEFKIPAVRKQLSVGDIWLVTPVDTVIYVAEFKHSLSDMISSIHDGRYADQVARLLRLCNLMTEANMPSDDRFPVVDWVVFGSLNHIQQEEDLQSVVTATEHVQCVHRNMRVSWLPKEGNLIQKLLGIWKCFRAEFNGAEQWHKLPTVLHVLRDCKPAVMDNQESLWLGYLTLHKGVSVEIAQNIINAGYHSMEQLREAYHGCGTEDGRRNLLSDIKHGRTQRRLPAVSARIYQCLFTDQERKHLYDAQATPVVVVKRSRRDPEGAAASSAAPNTEPIGDEEDPIEEVPETKSEVGDK